MWVFGDIATLLIGLLLFTITVSVQVSKYPELVYLAYWCALKWESLLSLPKAWCFYDGSYAGESVS